MMARYKSLNCVNMLIEMSELPNGSLIDNWQKLSKTFSWGYIVQNCSQFNNISQRHSSFFNLIGDTYEL